MELVLLVIHIVIVITMIILVLLQRSEGGALGIGGGGNFMSRRALGNALTRTTIILATLFFLTSIGLTVIATLESNYSVLDEVIETDDSSNIQAPGPLIPESESDLPKPE